MNRKTMVKVLKILQDHHLKWDAPVLTLISKKSKRDPFKVLIGTLLSSRTKDPVTHEATNRLFSVAETPSKILNLTTEQIERLIYPVGFYREKARRIKEVSKIILEKHSGKVPNRLEELLKLPGVGRKTANLVLSEAFGIDAICVDTHVHRITNRLGFVRSKNPKETEMQLMKKLPRKWWIPLNKLLVAFGQSVCKPTNPGCDICPVFDLCERVGVKKKAKGISR